MRRFGRDEFFRMFEMEKVVCGDAAILKLPDLKMQAIESDEITKPSDLPVGLTTALKDCGVQVDSLGRPVAYCICSRGRTETRTSSIHMEPTDNVIFDAYWTRYKSQYRGVSPLSTAITTVQDLHEGFE